MKKSVICYKSHFLNKHIIQEYKRLKAEIDSSRCDVVMLYDNSRDDFKSFEGGGSCALFDANDIRKMGYRVHEDMPIWYNCDYSALFFYKQHSEYSYYWMVEYDVYFNGSWELFFKAFNQNDSDLLATRVKTPQQEPDWEWWNCHNLAIQSCRQKGVFFPIARFSNRALTLLDEQYKLGKQGFCEVVVPTLLDTNGYKVSDLGENFYERNRFKWRPAIPFEFLYWLPKNKLYHPVKDRAGVWAENKGNMERSFNDFKMRLIRKTRKVLGLKKEGGGSSSMFGDEVKNGYGNE